MRKSQQKADDNFDGKSVKCAAETAGLQANYCLTWSINFIRLPLQVEWRFERGNWAPAASWVKKVGGAGSCNFLMES